MDTLQAWKERLEAWFGANHDSDDGAHDLSHFRRVWRTARELNEAEGSPADALVLLAAAYLHDVVALPKSHPERHTSSRLAAAEAERILRGMGFPEEKLALVQHAIEAHSFSARIAATTPEAKIIQDADRMEALGAIGIARVFYTSGRMQRAMFHPEDPLGKARPLDDVAYGLDHFFVKLYSLVDSMQTAAGRSMALRRRQVLERYVQDLLGEL
jgi:uncharacterized protein